MIVYICDVDMTPGGRRPIIRVSQYDSDFSLVFRPFSTTGIFTLESGTTAKIRGTKPDGNGYTENATVDTTENTVTVTGDIQMTAAAGKCVYELSLTHSNKELNTINFILDVERAALDKDTVSASQIREFVYVYDRIDELKAAAKVITHSIDPTLKYTGRAADAGATGAAVDHLQEQIDTLNDGGLNISQETVAENVQEWLDNHPESTTTVTDGSLTDVKLKPEERKRRMLFFDTVAELEGANLILGQWAHVRGVCFPEYDAKDLDFKIVSECKQPYITLENGLYAEPVCEYREPEPFTPEEAYNFIKCGLSYFDRKNMVYTPAGEPYQSIYAETMGKSSDNEWYFDCSSFIQAVLTGVTYDNSRFVRGQDADNIPAPWAYTFPTQPASVLQPARTRGFTACELAFYAYTHGWLFEVSENASNLRPGDILFEDYVGKNPDAEATYKNVFREIGHVQLVIDKISPFDNGVKVLEAGHGPSGVDEYPGPPAYQKLSLCHISSYMAGPSKNAKYAARFPAHGSAIVKDITAKRSRNNYPITLSGNLPMLSGVIYTTETLKAGELYTMVIKGPDIAKLKSKWYPFVRLCEFGGAMIYNCATYASSTDGALNTTYMIFTPLRDTDAKTIYNAVRFGVHNSTAGAGEMSVTIDDIRIFRGLYVGETEAHEHDVSVTFNSTMTAQYIKAVDGTHFLFDGEFAVGAGETEIGEIDIYSYGDRMWPIVMYAVNNVSTNDSNQASLIQRFDSSTNKNKLLLKVSHETGLTVNSVRVHMDIDFAT